MDTSKTTRVAGTTRTRRALLGGAVAGGAAIAMRSVGGTDRALAGNHPLEIGEINSATADTVLERTDIDINIAMCGNTYGLIARPRVVDSTGVLGAVDKSGGVGLSGQTSGDSSQIAVLADTTKGNGEGIAVKAITKNGIALNGEAVGGHALHVQGVTWFSRSGKALIAQGRSSKTLVLSGHGNYITNDSFVVATVQGTATGVWVRSCSTSAADNSVTIRLNKAAPSDLRVGWIVID